MINIASLPNLTILTHAQLVELREVINTQIRNAEEDERMEIAARLFVDSVVSFTVADDCLVTGTITRLLTRPKADIIDGDGDSWTVPLDQLTKVS